MQSGILERNTTKLDPFQNTKAKGVITMKLVQYLHLQESRDTGENSWTQQKT
jgi:hypothetical protein